jgi:hypothetical protein
MECFPDDAEAAWAAVRAHERIDRLIDEPHFSVSTLACRACGQRFADVFCERIDWQDGQDPQSWLIIPISDDETRTLAAAGEPTIARALSSLAPKRRCLEVHHFGGPPQVRYAAGPYGLPPHD